MASAVQRDILTAQAKREKKLHDKPYLTCTWYPHQCDGGCDNGEGPCRDYRDDSDFLEDAVYFPS